MKQILFGLFFLLPYPPLSARAHTVSVLLEKGRKLGQRVAELASRLKRKDKPRQRVR
jgi:hypothetical protein